MQTRNPLRTGPGPLNTATGHSSDSEITVAQQRKILAAHQNAANAMLEHLRAINKHDRTLLNPLPRTIPECHQVWAETRRRNAMNNDLYAIASQHAADLTRIGRAPGIGTTFGTRPTQPPNLYPEQHWTPQEWTRFLDRLTRAQGLNT